MASTPERPSRRVISVHPTDAARRKGYNYEGLSVKPDYTREELISAFTETAPACHHAPHVIFERKLKVEIEGGLSEIEKFLGETP
jgi:hypothetical protein